MPAEVHTGDTRPLVRVSPNGIGHRASLINDPAYSLRLVTPDNATDLPDGPCKSLWIGIAGDVELIAADDEDPVILTNVPVGELRVSAKRVRAAGTTADEIVAFYDFATGEPA